MYHVALMALNGPDRPAGWCPRSRQAAIQHRRFWPKRDIDAGSETASLCCDRSIDLLARQAAL